MLGNFCINGDTCIASNSRSNRLRIGLSQAGSGMHMCLSRSERGNYHLEGTSFTTVNSGVDPLTLVTMDLPIS